MFQLLAQRRAETSGDKPGRTDFGLHCELTTPESRKWWIFCELGLVLLLLLLMMLLAERSVIFGVSIGHQTEIYYTLPIEHA